MSRKARIGVIGTGWWATFAHIPNLKARPDAELVALADIRPDVLSKAAALYEVRRTYTDFREMLSKEVLDGVVIAVWHAAHYEVARACLEKGHHMVLEKPMVLRAAHARDLCEMAATRNLEIIMSYPWNYLPQTRRARDVLESGDLGRVHYVVDIFSSPALHLYRGLDHSDRPEVAVRYPVQGPGEVYMDPKRSGGGQGHLQMTHSAALMFFITGLKAVSVQAQMDNLDVQVDVVDAVIARMDNGALASLGSTGALKGGGGRLDVQIFCERGWIELAYHQGTGRIHFENGSKEDLTPDPQAPDPQNQQSRRYPAHLPCHNLIDVILGRSGNRSPAEVGWRTVELLDAAYRSAAEDGRVIAVDSLY